MGHPDGPGELGIGGAMEIRPVSEDDDGIRRLADRELIEEPLGARIVDLEPVLQDAVARGEIAQPVRVGVEPRANDLDARTEPLDRQAAPEQRLQEDVPEDQLAAEQRAEVLCGHDEHRTCLADHAVRMDAMAGQDAELGHQVAGPVDRDLSRRVAAAQHNGNQPLQQHHEVVGCIALAEEHVAHVDRPPGPERSEQRQLLIRQLREQHRVVVVQQGHPRPPGPLSSRWEADGNPILGRGTMRSGPASASSRTCYRYRRSAGRASSIGRTSIAPSLADGQREASSTAPSRSRASTTKKPPMTSFASANGPSVTLGRPARTCTVAAFRVLCNAYVTTKRPLPRSVSTWAIVSSRSAAHSLDESALSFSSSSYARHMNFMAFSLSVDVARVPRCQGRSARGIATSPTSVIAAIGST